MDEYAKVAEASHNAIMDTASDEDRVNVKKAKLHDIVTMSNGWFAVKHENDSVALCESMGDAQNSIRMVEIKARLIRKRQG